MKLTILGCHSAIPRKHRKPTSQVLEIKNHLFLIDCAEGTQVELRRNKVKFSKIKHVFISHLHGDHYYGLIGLISSYQLLNRREDLHIYSPKGLKEVILLQLKLANTWTKFNLVFHELKEEEPQLIFEDGEVTVHTVPLDHRIYTNGFIFKEKPGERKLDYKKAVNAKIDVAYFRKLKKGKDVPNKEGRIISNNEVTYDPPSPRSYAFCSDTAYSEKLAKHVKGVNVMYHESTFLEEHKHLAEPTKHSTAKQAAEIAKQAKVEHLILGHFSTRYEKLEPFLTEAQEIFKNTIMAEDGKTLNLDKL